MSKINAFIRLDFITMKSNFTLKNMAIYAALVLFLTYIGSSGSSSMAVGIMFGVMFVTYPFALGEKCNMDALYTTLSLDRKTVVAGRYLFTLALDICIAFVMLILTVAIMLVTGETGMDAYMFEVPSVMGIMLVIIAVVQAVMLPIYFKLGYTKARFVSILPFAMLMTAYLAFFAYPIAQGEGANTVRLVVLLGSLGVGGIVAFAALCIALFLYASYRLSIYFYKKREF